MLKILQTDSKSPVACASKRWSWGEDRAYQYLVGRLFLSPVLLFF